MALNRPQRKHLADLLKDSANVILGASVVGGFVEGILRWQLIAAGVVIYVGLAMLTTRMQRR
jgi:hypothetical protein